MIYLRLQLIVLSVVLVINKTKVLVEQNNELTEAKQRIEKQKLELEHQQEQLKSVLEATQKELDKIKQLNESIEKIDDRFFVYNSNSKRHTLKEDIKVSFEKYKSDIYAKTISQNTRLKLDSVGYAIHKFMLDAQKEIPEAEYLLIVEGQASKDPYSKNNELSYERALALVNYWKSKGILFYSYKDGFKVKNNLPFELIVSGSGISSEFREVNEPDNQRFVIHIIPKPGLLN
jgi:hypothetical protein